MPTHRPIGFWAKLLDDLLEADLARALENFALTRRYWQILNVIQISPHTATEIAEELAPFLGTKASAEYPLQELENAGWLERDGTKFDLTEMGRTRLVEAREAIGATRERIAEGISRDDYDTTVSTLQRMCVNLGWTD